MIDDFIKQLRDNPRLRWGVALIVGLFWLYAILLLRETLLEQEQQHRATAQSISWLRAQLAQPEWAARVAPAKIMADAKFPVLGVTLAVKMPDPPLL